MKLNALDWLALILMVIGSLNWGLVGAFEFNLVTALFGTTSLLTNAIFTVVGLAAMYVLAVFIPKIINPK